MNGLTILSGISLIFISCFSIWTLGMIMEKDIADSTRHTVETAYGILGHYQKLEQQGTLSHEAARHQALEAIRTLRFNTSDYFWVTDLDGRMAMHPLKPALEGTDVRSLTDSNGNRISPSENARADRVSVERRGFTQRPAGFSARKAW